MTPLLTL